MFLFDDHHGIVDSPGEVGVGEGVLGGVDPCFLLKIPHVVVAQH
jgi:hypothetical protein